MNDAELVLALSVKAGADPETTRSVLRALLDLVRQGAISEDILLDPDGFHLNGAAHHHIAAPAFIRAAGPADSRLVDDLIVRAQSSPLKDLD